MKSNRLNPDPESRKGLKELRASGVLGRRKVGIRHIIRAATNDLQQIGYDLDALHGPISALPNLCRWFTATAWVGYDGGRAHLTASQSRSAWGGHDVEVSRLAVNQQAYDLLHQDCTKGAFFNGVPVHGNAILVSDARAHWFFDRDISDEEFELFDLTLTTSRDVVTGIHGRKWIFFHEEPCADDIIIMKLRWL